MKLKLVLAAALFMSTGTFVAQAQHRAAATKNATASDSKAFTKKIDLFKAETDATKSSSIFNDLNFTMMKGVSDAKSEIVAATSDAQKTAANTKTSSRVNSMTEAVRLFKADPNNKAGIAAALTKYAQTL
jgi:hypothetical protein